MPNLIRCILSGCFPLQMSLGYAAKMTITAVVGGLMQRGRRGSVDDFTDDPMRQSLPVLSAPITKTSEWPRQAFIPIIGKHNLIKKSLNL